MKKLFLPVVVLSVLSFTVAADEVCERLAEYAEIAMEAHQSGVSLSQMLKITDELIPEHQDITEVYRDLVIDAYSKPRFMTDEVRQVQISDFRDDTHVMCLKARSK